MGSARARRGSPAPFPRCSRTTCPFLQPSENTPFGHEAHTLASGKAPSLSLCTVYRGPRKECVSPTKTELGSKTFSEVAFHLGASALAWLGLQITAETSQLSMKGPQV